MQDVTDTPASPLRPRDQRERTVLIVDDSVTARAAIKLMISEESGWRVVGTAADGEQGLAKILSLIHI